MSAHLTLSVNLRIQAFASHTDAQHQPNSAQLHNSNTMFQLQVV